MKDSPVTLEPCRPIDPHARLVMAWRNDPETLAVSFHKEPKVWPGFGAEFRSDYFAADVPDPCFARLEGARIGFLRFRPLDPPPGARGRWVDVSINLAPAHRGQGLGMRTLGAALTWLERRGVAGVLAEIRVGNDASCLAFQGAGFQLAGEVEHVVADTGERCRVFHYVKTLNPAAHGTVRGLFLDLDGTLAETLGIMRQVYGAVLAQYGKQGSDAEFESLNGPPLAEVARRLHGTHGLPGTPEGLLTEYGARVDALYAQAPPREGARALLEAAREQGWRTVLVTSNSLERSAMWLERSGLNPWLEHLVCAEHVTRGKPDPEPYLRALRLSGADPARSLAVEDSEQGVRAALGAGVETWGVGARAWPAGVRALTRLEELIPRLHRSGGEG